MSGLIPRPFIDELLNRTDLVELIDSFIPLKKRGNSYLACCPFHSEKTPSFNVVSKKQFYHCFGCGASGNAISFIMEYLQQGFTEAIETLAARCGMAVPRDHTRERKQTKNLYQLLEGVSQYYQQLLKTRGKEAIDYLRQRGLNGEVARRFQIGYASPGWHDLENHFRQNKEELVTSGMLIKKEDGGTYDRYRHRIMFPIHDRHGRIIGFGGRAIDAQQQPKYLNSPETALFQKNRELYGLYQCLQQQQTDSIVVVEGYLDVIALAQYGINNAVATLGTATSTFHVQLLSKHCRQLYFCFDGDNAGRQAAWRALESCLPELNNGLDVHFVFLPEKDDPDSLIRRVGASGWHSLLKNAMPLADYFFATLADGIATSSLAGKTQLIARAKNYLLIIGKGAYRELLVQELSRRTRLEADRIEKILQEKDILPGKTPVINRSPLRLAISLLLQNPHLVQMLNSHHDEQLNKDRELQVLAELVRQIRLKPQTTTAILIESWRDNELFESMKKLACWQHQVPNEALAHEFVEIMRFLLRQSTENKINYYLEKSRQEGLAEEERIELQALLQERHKTVKE